MARATINRTNPGSGDSHAVFTDASGANREGVVLAIDGVDAALPADATNGLDVDVTRIQGVVTVEPAGTTGAQSSVSATVTANTTLIAADATRVGLTIYNESSAVLTVLMGAGTQSATVYTVQIPANGYYEVPGAMVSLRASGNWTSATGAARITAVT
jgi:hypothetical protein